ncbi:MAG: hypothetical protein R3F37_04735 [Candidatus Competibacteraceae bacterium]
MPKIVDDYLKAPRTEDRADVNNTVWFIDRFQHHHDAQGLENSEIGYGLLVNVAENLGLHEGAVLYEYAARHDPSVVSNEPFSGNCALKSLPTCTIIKPNYLKSRWLSIPLLFRI